VVNNIEGQYRVRGWVASAVFHSIALAVALGLMAQAKHIAMKEPFKWDIALVEPQLVQEMRQADVTPTQEPVKPMVRPIVPAPRNPKMVRQDVQPREAMQVREQPPTEVQQPQKTVVEPVAPVMQQEAITPEPVISAAPMQQAVAEPITTEALAHPIEAHTTETAPVTHNPDSSVPPAANGSDAKSSESVAKESAPQTLMATHSAPAVKVNDNWLGESLGRRLAELKRYPNSARLNGWEGKVVLRAVIRADGHLSEVKIHRSSGHEALDNAAIETVRLACPLHMHRPLSKPEVAILVPIVYSFGG
jgi:protein TonB